MKQRAGWKWMGSSVWILWHLKDTSLSYTEVILDLQRRGLGRRSCRRRENFLVMKESSDPLLKFEDYNCAGRNRMYFRELVQNKEYNMTKSETLLCSASWQTLDLNHVVFWALRYMEYFKQVRWNIRKKLLWKKTRDIKAPFKAYVVADPPEVWVQNTCVW